MTAARSLFRNAAYLTAAEAVVRVASVVSFVLVSRIVGPADVGQFVFAIALISYAAVLGDAGLTTCVQRQLAASLVPAGPAVTATTVVRLLEDEDVRRTMAESARRLVERTYDWRSIALAYERDLLELAGPTRRSNSSS